MKSKEIKIKLKTAIILIVIFIFIIFCILFIALKIYSNNSNNLENSSDNIEIPDNYKYITQKSSVSPTNVEFIGDLSDNIKTVFEDEFKSYTSQFKYYNTTINNMKVYSIEDYLTNLTTNLEEKAIERQYYYNADNNKIIAHRYYISYFPQYKRSLESRNMTLDEFETTYTNANLNIFRNVINDQSEENMERAKKYVEYWENQINENGKVQGKVIINSCEYTYEVLGDMLKACRFFNNNKSFEFLFLAYDTNSSPTDTLRNWVKSVYLRDIKNSGVSNNFINEIKLKYPDESELICTNNDEYWLLDKDGKKVYFYDLDSFESALSLTQNSTIGNAESSESDYNDNSNYANTNGNINTAPNNSNDDIIYIFESDISSLDEDSLYNFLDSNNLKYNVITRKKNVPYLDKNSGKSEFELSRYGEYQSGSTVYITKTTYTGVDWNANISFTDLADVSINYNGGVCSFSESHTEDFVGLLEYPQDEDVYYTPIGMNYYINGNLLNKTDNYYKYTFSSGNTASLKVVVPYLYSYKEQKVVGQNVTIYQNTIDLHELYTMGGDIKKIELPSRY